MTTYFRVLKTMPDGTESFTDRGDPGGVMSEVAAKHGSEWLNEYFSDHKDGRKYSYVPSNYELKCGN